MREIWVHSSIYSHDFAAFQWALIRLFACVQPYRILSSLPNLLRKEPNHVSGKDGQISLSVSCDNEKSRSTSCITLAIIDGDVGEQLLNSSMVGCEYRANILLKLFRQSRIAFQPKTNGKWAMIDNIRELKRILTIRVSSDCLLNSATISAGFGWVRDYQRQRWEFEIKFKMIECRTSSNWLTGQQSPVGSSAGY